MSVRLSVRMEQLGSHWTDFHEIWYLRILRNSVEKVQVLLKSDKNERYFTWRPMCIFQSYLAHFFFRTGNISDKSCRENQNIHFVTATFFPPENRAVYEKMWKNIVERVRPQVIIWRMRIAYWIPKATDALRLCNTHYFSTATVVAWTRFSVTLHVHWTLTVLT
jgi:hypothetical protein